MPKNGYVSRFTETLSPSTETTDSDTTLTVTPYKGTFYDWVYYNPDASNPALTGLLVVPTISSSGNLAYIDYPNGTIYYSGTKSDTVTVTYDYYTVYVQDGYPDFGDDLRFLNDIRIPLVSVDFQNGRNVPFAIGGSIQEDRMFMIDVLGGSDAMVKDIADTIEQNLRYDFTNTIDYSYGFPLLFNGDRNLNFDRGLATQWKALRFENTTMRAIRQPDTLPEKLRHRAQVIVDLRLH